MSFSIKTVFVLMLAVALAIGWWIDHRKQKLEIERLDQLPRHTIIRADHAYFEMMFANKRLEAAPEWPNFQGQPPVALAEVSEISRKMLSELKSRARSNGYQDVWISQICLLPIVNHDDRKEDDLPASWCYVLDFHGEQLPAKSGVVLVQTGKKLKPPSPVYRAVVLMDGSTYSCASPHLAVNADHGLANSMLEIYPTSETIGITYYKSQLARLLQKALGPDVKIFESNGN